LSCSDREDAYKVLALPEEKERIAYRLYDPKVPEERALEQRMPYLYM